MGCEGCNRSASGGCDAHKGPQRALIDRVFELVYPDGTWGHPDDEARFGAGVSPREVRRLSRAISTAARAPTFVRPGGDDDLCEFVYVLCVGREPALVDVRDRGAPLPELPSVQEQYLRVAFSTVARAACIQEVALELEDGVVRELPKPGVYDGKLLKRMRAIVDLVEASGVEHLDFGLCDQARPDARPGDYVARYGVEPAVVNFLFYAQPARTVSTTVLAADEARVAADDGGEGRVAPERG